MVDQARARKLADRIAQIVAEMLERRIKDPRLGFITVTEARAYRRPARGHRLLHRLRIRRGPVATAAALASATGVIRSEVGHQTGLKHTPSLTFVADTLPEGARHMEDLVARAREADARLAEVREGAVTGGVTRIRTANRRAPPQTTTWTRTTGRRPGRGRAGRRGPRRRP